MFSQKTVYLASASPRRYEILANLGFQVIVLSSNIDETAQINETPADFVCRMAKEKNNFVFQQVKDKNLPVISADTIVVLNGTILGKPKNQQQAFDMLRALSNKTHFVMTAVCVAGEHFCQSKLNVSEVTFAPLSDKEITAYIATGEPMDKAGAYGIQGIGASFVQHLSGSFSAVMGLPVFETVALLKEFWTVSSSEQ
ncbi:MAG: septum formation inhibitor Maf [Neisseriaceae bacterium]|nr:septum formation inhibitor Maf [Neisseriaceae bacterium]